ncbi:MAG: MGDG synthase family glycosyltransferase [Chroococcales cyanobacterium]
MKKVHFMIYDMGAGHRSTANALKTVIQQRQLPWEIEIVEVFKEVFQQTINHYIYNDLILKNKWAKRINDPLLVPLFRLQIRLRHQTWLNQLKQYWREHQPDLVVSLLPLVNQVLGESVAAELPNTPFVTSMTDFADCPPHFWMETETQFLICPSELAVKQSQAFAYPKTNIFQTSGIVIHPRFNEPTTINRAAEKQRLGLDPNLPTGLVLFGGYGSNDIIEIAKQLEESSLNLQIIYICGHNDQLAQTLRRNLPNRFSSYVEGFTKEIPYYMDLCDFFIGKPGSVGISEALARNLPVITQCNHTTTLFQERASADWLVKNEFGIVVNNFGNVTEAVTQLIEPENFARYRANVKAYSNRAVFEVVDILEKILEDSELKAASKPIEVLKSYNATVPNF